MTVPPQTALQTPLSQATLLLHAMHLPNAIPTDLAHASLLLDMQMKNAFHAQYRLHLYPHAFRDEGLVAGVFCGERRVGDTSMAPGELHQRWIALREELGEPALNLAQRLQPEFAENQIAAMFNLSNLMPVARDELARALESGQTFVTTWWSAEQGLGEGQARCGCTNGLPWVEVCNSQNLAQTALRAAERVVQEAPSVLEQQLRQEAVAHAEGVPGALAQRYGLTLAEMDAELDRQGLKDFFLEHMLLSEVNPGDLLAGQDSLLERALVGIDELSALISRKLHANYETLTTLLRGDLYVPATEVEPDPPFHA